MNISFIIPCYNDGKTIERTVNSIRDQDLPDIEIIVINDGSTDNSLEVLQGLESIGAIDVLINFEKNQGACAARNAGDKIAKGKYLAHLPADSILYPGMARIWFETLEDNSTYDFLYGGYRFLEEDGEPSPGNDYISQPFDPYLLDVTNYIDGSFPIKTESYWNIAKKIGKEDGLWDSEVKSLQDWDFWLTIVKNGGKGIYVQDIFFGTTLPHEGGLSFDSANNWLERTEFIKKKHGIPIRRLCVASLGATYHGKKVAYMLDADYKEMPSFKPHRYDGIYVIGFYPQFALQQDQMFLNNVYKPDEGRTPAIKIVHFVGSDIWQMYNLSINSLKVWKEYFKQNISYVLAEDEFTQKELAELGIEAKVLPIPPAKLYEPMPFPKDFTVACYMPGVNRDFYRPKEMFEIAKKLPDIKFLFFGNAGQVGKDPALSQNIDYVGYVNMDDLIPQCTAIMRFPQHDGLPLSVLEFITAGRYSIQSVPIEHSMWVKNFTIDNAVNAILEVKKESEKGLNIIGSDYWRDRLDHKKFKEAIYKMIEYKPKEYWENRAESWIEQAKAMPIESTEIKEFLEKIKPQSVVDIGCGDARWYPIFKELNIEYSGFDISAKLIEAAKLRYPHLEKNLWTAAVEDDYKKDKKDLIFSYTCLEHIKDEDFPKAVKQIKKMGKQILIIEPTNFISRNYCHDHDYKKYFEVLEEKQLKDKIIYLCDLA